MMASVFCDDQWLKLNSLNYAYAIMCAFDNPSNYLWAVLALSGANGQPDRGNS